MDTPGALEGRLMTGFAAASLLIALLVASQAITAAPVDPSPAKPQPYERMP